MSLRIPFFKQDTAYSCGPVALQMILAFFGDRKSEYELVRRMHMNKAFGTRHEWMIVTARKEGFFCYVNNNSSLHEIEHFLSLHLPVIVHFNNPTDDDDHYSVIVGLTSDTVVFNDPWNGKGFKISRKVFLSHWYGDQAGKNYKQWMMVVSDKDLNIGRQYSPLKKNN